MNQKLFCILLILNVYTFTSNSSSDTKSISYDEENQTFLTYLENFLTNSQPDVYNKSYITARPPKKSTTDSKKFFIQYPNLQYEKTVGFWFLIPNFQAFTWYTHAATEEQTKKQSIFENDSNLKMHVDRLLEQKIKPLFSEPMFLTICEIIHGRLTKTIKIIDRKITIVDNEHRFK
ncbi:hypothetical protein KAZ82_01065 [Candidatus Babeliales bacterium]|nr:hypothetical protein [Candidatus Babeliales bacterium]